jgi:hypothetical protein
MSGDEMMMMMMMMTTMVVVVVYSIMLKIMIVMTIMIKEYMTEHTECPFHGVSEHTAAAGFASNKAAMLRDGTKRTSTAKLAHMMIS